MTDSVTVRAFLAGSFPPLATLPPPLTKLLRIPAGKSVERMGIVAFAAGEREVPALLPMNRRKAVVVMTTYGSVYVCDAAKGTVLRLIPMSSLRGAMLVSQEPRAQQPVVSGEKKDVDEGTWRAHSAAAGGSLRLTMLDEPDLVVHFGASRKLRPAIDGGVSAAELARTVAAIHDATVDAVHPDGSDLPAHLPVAIGIAPKPHSCIMKSAQFKPPKKPVPLRQRAMTGGSLINSPRGGSPPPSAPNIAEQAARDEGLTDLRLCGSLQLLRDDEDTPELMGSDALADGSFPSDTYLRSPMSDPAVSPEKDAPGSEAAPPTRCVPMAPLQLPATPPEAAPTLTAGGGVVGDAEVAPAVSEEGAVNRSGSVEPQEEPKGAESEAPEVAAEAEPEPEAADLLPFRKAVSLPSRACPLQRDDSAAEAALDGFYRDQAANGQTKAARKLAQQLEDEWRGVVEPVFDEATRQARQRAALWALDHMTLAEATARAAIATAAEKTRPVFGMPDVEPEVEEEATDVATKAETAVVADATDTADGPPSPKDKHKDKKEKSKKDKGDRDKEKKAKKQHDSSEAHPTGPATTTAASAAAPLPAEAAEGSPEIGFLSSEKSPRGSHSRRGASDKAGHGASATEATVLAVLYEAALEDLSRLRATCLSLSAERDDAMRVASAVVAAAAPSATDGAPNDSHSPRRFQRHSSVGVQVVEGVDVDDAADVPPTLAGAAGPTIAWAVRLDEQRALNQQLAAAMAAQQAQHAAALQAAEARTEAALLEQQRRYERLLLQQHDAITVHRAEAAKNAAALRQAHAAVASSPPWSGPAGGSLSAPPAVIGIGSGSGAGQSDRRRAEMLQDLLGHQHRRVY